MLEVLLTLALMGTVGLLFQKLILNAVKGQQAVTAKSDFNSLMSTIGLVLSKKATCDQAFWNANESAPAKYHPTIRISESEKLGSLKLGSGSFAKIGGKLNTGGLTISKLNLSPVLGVPVDTTSIPGKSIYTVQLVVEVTKNSDDQYGGKTVSNIKNPFRVAVVTDFDGSSGTHRIEGCHIGTVGTPILALYVDASNPTVVPAGRCPNAIRVDMQMDARRGDSSPGTGHFKTFSINVNGANSPQQSIQFGSDKDGDTGHYWGYRVNGISKSFFITNVGVANTLTPLISGSPVISVSNAVYTVSCL